MTPIPARAYLVPVMCALLLMAICSKSRAQDTPPARFSCWSVRQALKLYDEATLLNLARQAGVSEQEITRLQRCPR